MSRSSPETTFSTGSSSSAGCTIHRQTRLLSKAGSIATLQLPRGRCVHGSEIEIRGDAFILLPTIWQLWFELRQELVSSPLASGEQTNAEAFSPTLNGKVRPPRRDDSDPNSNTTLHQVTKRYYSSYDTGHHIIHVIIS